MISKDLVRQDFIGVDKEDTISRLIGKFRSSKKTEAVVLSGKKYAGIVCKRKLLKSRILACEEKIKKIAMKPAVLDGSESLEKTARLMYTSDVHMLPVVKKGILKGIVYAIDVLKNLVDVIGDKKVSDISSGKVIALDQHTEIDKALSIMRQRKIDRAPLVNGNNKLSGIISIVDLVMKYTLFPVKSPGGKNIRESRSSLAKQRASKSVYVIHDATFDVVTATRNDKLKAVIGLMVQNRISDVVVIDEYNQPAGIVTIKDLLKLF